MQITDLVRTRNPPPRHVLDKQQLQDNLDIATRSNERLGHKWVNISIIYRWKSVLFAHSSMAQDNSFWDSSSFEIFGGLFINKFVLKAYQDVAGSRTPCWPVILHYSLRPKIHSRTHDSNCIHYYIDHRPRYLHDGDDAGDHDHEVGRLPVVPQAARDDAESGVPEHAKRSHLHNTINATLQLMWKLMLGSLEMVLGTFATLEREKRQASWLNAWKVRKELQMLKVLVLMSELWFGRFLRDEI